MKAVLVRQPGGPEQLVLAERENPRPGPGELLVRVRATAVNRADILQREGKYPPPPGASDILGLEMAGEVAALGEGVTGWREGDPVFALLSGGGYAELVTVPAAHALRKPEYLSFQEAAAIPEAFLTAYRNLFDLGGLRPGQRVLIHAGGSGVGTAAIQLAKEKGAWVAVTAGHPEKLRRCLELGADLAIDYREGPFAPRVREATGGSGVDLILDPIGAAYWEQNLEVLGWQGRLVIIAVMGGVRVEGHLGRVLRNNWQIIGSTLRSQSPEYKADLIGRFWAETEPAFRAGRLRPVIDRVYPLAEVAAAHRYMEENRNFGKIVLEV